MKRVLVTLAVAALAAGAMSGCSNGTKKYCNEIKTAQSSLKVGADPTDSASMQKSLDEVKKVAGLSPDSVKGDWTNLSNFLQAFVNAKGDTTKMAALSSQAKTVQTSATNIQNEVKKDCNITLSTTTG